jgi:hypothetical protein
MAALSEWLQLMLGEIAARRDQAAHAQAEQHTRLQEQPAAGDPAAVPAIAPTHPVTPAGMDPPVGGAVAR